MNKNAKKWVKALKSDKYAQTKGTLCRVNADGEPTGYCCLGVACEVFNKANPGVLRISPSTFGIDVNIRFYDGKSSVLPDVVGEWLGLKSRAGDYHYAEGCFTSCLTQDNDDGKTFTQIAGIIKRNQEELFTSKENEDE